MISKVLPLIVVAQQSKRLTNQNFGLLWSSNLFHGQTHTAQGLDFTGSIPIDAGQIARYFCVCICLAYISLENLQQQVNLSVLRCPIPGNRSAVRPVGPAPRPGQRGALSARGDWSGRERERQRKRIGNLER